MKTFLRILGICIIIVLASVGFITILMLFYTVYSNNITIIDIFILSQGKDTSLTKDGIFWTNFVFPILAGSVGLIALYFTYQRTEAIIDQTENGRRQIIVEQFKNAIDQLGNDKNSVVLGGVHTLHYLACHYPEEYRKTVFDILCSFIREETSKQDYISRGMAWFYLKQCGPTNTSLSGEEKIKYEAILESSKDKLLVSPNTVQTIVTLLFCGKLKNGVYKGLTASLNGSCLIRCNMSNLDLSFADLSNCRLEMATLDNACMTGATLTGAYLHRASLCKAHLEGAKLLCAKLDGANLSHAHLEGADLLSASLRRTTLCGAHCEGAELTSAQIDDRTNFKKASLRGARAKLGTKPIEPINSFKNNLPLHTELIDMHFFDKTTPEPSLVSNDCLKDRGAIVDDLSADEVQNIFRNIRDVIREV